MSQWNSYCWYPYGTRTYHFRIFPNHFRIPFGTTLSPPAGDDPTVVESPPAKRYRFATTVRVLVRSSIWQREAEIYLHSILSTKNICGVVHESHHGRGDQYEGQARAGATSWARPRLLRAAADGQRQEDQDPRGWGRLDRGLLPLVASFCPEPSDLGRGRLVCRQWAAELPEGCTSLAVRGKGPDVRQGVSLLWIGGAEMAVPEEFWTILAETEEPTLRSMQKRGPWDIERPAGPVLPQPERLRQDYE